MSGRGVFSARMPESKRQALLLNAKQRGLDVNDLVRIVVGDLVGLSGADILRIPEPPLEAVNPRLSFYLGQEKVGELNAAASRSGLNPSSVLRRALHAAVTRNLMPPVEPEEGGVSVDPTVFLIVLLILFAVLVGAACVYFLRKRQKKTLGGAKKVKLG